MCFLRQHSRLAGPLSLGGGSETPPPPTQKKKKKKPPPPTPPPSHLRSTAGSKPYFLIPHGWRRSRAAEFGQCKGLKERPSLVTTSTRSAPINSVSVATEKKKRAGKRISCLIRVADRPRQREQARRDLRRGGKADDSDAYARHSAREEHASAQRGLRSGRTADQAVFRVVDVCRCTKPMQMNGRTTHVSKSSKKPATRSASIGVSNAEFSRYSREPSYNGRAFRNGFRRFGWNSVPDSEFEHTSRIHLFDHTMRIPVEDQSLSNA